jgi:hypothetical protein
LVLHAQAKPPALHVFPITIKPQRMGKYLLFLLLFLFSCEAHKKKPISKDEPSFEMSESARYFFRNVRSAYYHREEMTEAKVDIYRFKEFVPDSSRAQLHVKLVQYVLMSKAFAMLEPNAYLQRWNADTLHVYWKDTATLAAGHYAFPVAATQPQHFKFATELYTSLQAQHILRIKGPQGLEPIFAEEAEREAFRKTMVDFYRMVGLL